MNVKPIMAVAIAVTALWGGPPASGQVVPPSSSEIQKLLASDGGPSDKFGFALALQGDTLLVGAPHHYSPPDGLGSVYVFGRDAGGGWVESDRLFVADEVLGTEFGHALALDGDTFIAGAPFELDDKGAFMGAAYVFARDGTGTWSEVQKLQPAGIQGGDFFGNSVALDGDIAVLSGGGDAWVFVRGAEGSWSLQTVLQGFSAQTVALHDQTILIGGTFAPGDAGALAYVQDGAGWTQEAQLHLPATDPKDLVFVAVAIEGDTAVLGARSFFRDLDGAYVFVRSGPGQWSEQPVPLPEDVSDDNFGVSVDISGGKFIVGATHTDSTGAAWVYGRNPSGTWEPLVKLVPSDSPMSFGFAVTLDGTTPVVGAWADSQIVPFAGAAFAFADVGAPCPADLGGDGDVGILDLLALLANWGDSGGDVDGDGTTGIVDLLALLANWGPCG